MISTFSYCLGTSAANFLQTIMVISQVNMFTHIRIGVTNFELNGLALQNLLLPFASVVRRDNKFRLFFLFLCLKF